MFHCHDPNALFDTWPEPNSARRSSADSPGGIGVLTILAAAIAPVWVYLFGSGVGSAAVLAPTITVELDRRGAG
jgi:hypothetical protein